MFVEELKSVEQRLGQRGEAQANQWLAAPTWRVRRRTVSGLARLK
ncbi:Uncharacterized protein PPKH_4661 [Pseudomonas putida]|nr:Uncharacterized protein PPKH_4661 [Pseudomonas putida]